MSNKIKPMARAGKAGAADCKAAETSAAVNEFLNEIGVEKPIANILDNLYLMFDGIGGNEDKYAPPDELLPRYLNLQPDLVQESVFHAKETIKFLVKLREINT